MDITKFLYVSLASALLVTASSGALAGGDAAAGAQKAASCTSCHGANGEGAPNWRQRDANDQFPPPPLNGGGHSWHHPLSALRHTIRNGTQAIGGSMPAWKDKLSDADIYAVIAWFQSKWPERAYIAWYDIDQRARKRKQ